MSLSGREHFCRHNQHCTRLQVVREYLRVQLRQDRERHYAILMPQFYVNHRDPAECLIRRISKNPGTSTCKFTHQPPGIRLLLGIHKHIAILLGCCCSARIEHDFQNGSGMAVRHKNRTRGDAVNHYTMFLFCHTQERRDAIGSIDRRVLLSSRIK